jgi:glycosyltransferase involved in cell wall biosynthesis
LFPARDVRCFVVPNSPIFRERDLPPKTKRFVWGGSAFPGFGIGAALDFLSHYPDESLTIMGWVSEETRTLINDRYPELLREGRLSVTSEFQPDEEYITALAQNRFGFSFYDLGQSRDFFGRGRSILPCSHANYWTGFPGKIGMYMAAGVPVIGSDLPGMAFVEEHKVGVLIRDMGPDHIREAAARIDADYDSYRSNALSLGRHFCFRRHLQPFLDELARPA